MSSVIIHKPFGVETSVTDLFRKIVFFRAKHVGVLYSDWIEMKTRKFSEKTGDIGQADNFIKGLKDYPALLFFSSEKAKKFIRNRDNMPPVLVNKELGYVSAGDIVTLPASVDKDFTDINYMNSFSFQPITTMIPDFFFTFEGMWLLDNVAPNETGMAFMRVDGDVTLSNQDKWSNHGEMHYFDTVIASAKKKKDEKKEAKSSKGFSKVYK